MKKVDKEVVALIKNPKRESYKDIHGFFDWEDVYESLAEQLQDNYVFVEVGVWCGRSICFLGEQLKKRQKKPQIYAVDTFKGSKDEAGAVAIIKKLGGSLRPIFEENLKSLGLEDLITTIEKDSAEASLEFKDYSVAGAFIDANHSYEGVTRDLEAWWPKVQRGGWLFGHDLCGEEVARAVAEFFYREDPTLKVACFPPNTWAVRKPPISPVMRYMVDIDGTICTYKKGTPYKDATPLKERIKFFNDLYEQGHRVTYWTGRGSFSGVDYSELTERQLNEWGVKRTELNMGKPCYDFWIDDKAFNVEDFFEANQTTL